MNNSRIIFLVGGLLLTFSSVYADDLIAINKESKLYDKPNAKYATENQYGEEIKVVPGMVFKSTEHSPGWYKIEYSPGLHAYLPEQIVVESYKKPMAGNYAVANVSNEKIKVENNNSEWIAKTQNATYKGIVIDDIVVFNDESKNIKYTLIDFGEGSIVINYDNSVTRFF